MDARRLRYFVAAAEAENFRDAAERLRIAQPAISRQIAQLEADLGILLFARSKQKVRLTPAGQAYLADIRSLLIQIDAAGERARRISTGVTGTLRIGFHESAGREPIISEAFLHFRQLYPEIELQIVQRTSPSQIEALRTGELDAGIVFLAGNERQQFNYAPITTHYFHLAVSLGHRLAQRKALRLSDLQDEPFIWLARSVNANYADGLLRACIGGGLRPHITQEAQSETMTLNLVATGLVIGFVVSSSGKSWRPDIQFLQVQDLRHSLDMALVWPRGSTSETLKNFINLLQSFP